MQKILRGIIIFVMSVCVAQAQNLQIFSVDNAKGSINAKSIEKAFNESGVSVDVNNDMNSIFSKRYGIVHHEKYNLAIFTNMELVKKLMKKYPSIGLITPLSMSIYEDASKNTISISTLSLAGMAGITKIPKSDTDLIAYAKSVDTALRKALPNGKYLTVKHDDNNNDAKSPTPLTTEFTTEFELEDGDTYVELKDGLKEELMSELGPVGFLVPKSYTLEHDDYDFFDTYSIIRFNAIFPVSKNHPDAGAYAPFSLVLYKKKGDATVYIAFPSISNWIRDLGITEKETIKAVTETQERMKNILVELTE